MTTPQHSFRLAASIPGWLAIDAPIRVTPDGAYPVRDVVTVLKAAFADPGIVRPATRPVTGADPEPVDASVSLHADEGDGTPDGYRVLVAAPGEDYWLASRLIRPAGPVTGADLECAVAEAVTIASAMLHSWDDLACPS